jgi:hypothetical protein
VGGIWGKERDAGGTRGLRSFQQVLISGAVTPRVSIAAGFDYGIHDRGATSGTWYAVTGMARFKATEHVAVSVRAERYADPDGVLIAPGAGTEFVVNGGSLGLDLKIGGRADWRSEIRGFRATDAIYPDGTGTRRDNVFWVSSLGVTF